MRKKINLDYENFENFWKWKLKKDKSEVFETLDFFEMETKKINLDFSKLWMF